MKISALKTLLATSIFAAAGLAQAQPVAVTGEDQFTNPVSGNIDIDQHWQEPDPSPCLAFLQAIDLTYTSPAVNEYGKTWDETGSPAAGPTWAKNFVSEEAECGLEPSSVDGDFEIGFTVTYDWGTGVGTPSSDTNDAGDYTGYYSACGTNNPNWDRGQLVVVTDNVFNPLSITLTTDDADNHFVYSLTP